MKRIILVLLSALALAAPASTAPPRGDQFEDGGAGNGGPLYTGTCGWWNVGQHLDSGENWFYFCGSDGHVWAQVNGSYHQLWD